MESDLNETRDNVQNEQIYESIDECVRRNVSGPSSSSEGVKQPTACYGMAMPSTINAKKVLKNGADKLCDTFNNVKTKFGSLSQRLRRSTRRRTPLINSPGTPMGKNLGRTPVKMYSPFSIETPRGKENTSARRSLNRENFKKTPTKNRGQHSLDGITQFRTSPRLAQEMQETQIRVFEFHHAAERILKNLHR